MNVTERPPSVWELCRVCALQMVGGPRCYVHNPTPEQREAGRLTASGAVLPPATRPTEGYAAAFNPVDQAADEQCGHPCADYFAYGACRCTAMPEMVEAF